MTTSEAPNRIEGFWKGYLAGTNRGSLLVHVKQTIYLTRWAKALGLEALYREVTR